jgi:hypothetical protein
MNDDNAPHGAFGKRTSRQVKPVFGGLIDLADRTQMATLALVASTLSLIVTDVLIRLEFGTVKVRTGWIGNWDAAINSDNGWVCFLVIMAWLAILARCVTLSRQPAR